MTPEEKEAQKALRELERANKEFAKTVDAEKAARFVDAWATIMDNPVGRFFHRVIEIALGILGIIILILAAVGAWTVYAWWTTPPVAG